MRVCAFAAAAILCMAHAGFGHAGNPIEILLEGSFATEDGCKALETSLPEDLEEMEFMVISNSELMGMDFVCHFRDATASGGKSWSVKAECESGAPAEPAVITVKELEEGRLDVTMTSNGEPDHLGIFIFCTNPMAD